MDTTTMKKDARVLVRDADGFNNATGTVVSVGRDEFGEYVSVMLDDERVDGGEAVKFMPESLETI